MILRRITEHVKTQNWFAVALDFVIVVVGVFVGIQVSNWNAERQERQREAAYLQRLHADAVAAEAATLGLGENVADRVADADRVSSALFGDDMTVVKLDAKACDSIARLHIFYLEGYALPTLEELVASGQFGLIRDQGLLKSLSDYLSFTGFSPSRAGAVSARAPILRRDFPSMIATRVAITDGVRKVTNECDLAAMRTDPAFLNAFNEVRERAGFFHQRLLAPERVLLERIHIELDRVLAVDHGLEAQQ